MTENPAFVDFLIDLKTKLEHQRRFGPDTLQANRHAATQAEGDIEEFLIDHGYRLSEERYPISPPTRTTVEWVVSAGSGHGGPRTFDDHKKAREVYEHEAKVPSYMGKGMQSASIVRRTTIYDKLEKNR